MDPEAILAALNDEQREAARATTGPLVILAGAGTGKTRVISHRAAYAAATGAMDPKRALVVTFTEKAATEMRHRLNQLELPQIQASTFHAAARRQLAYHWPLVHGRDLPDVLDTKLRIIGPLARQLPGGYRFTPARDLADEIEWAKVRRMRPETYAPGREPPVRVDVFVDVWRRYEAAKVRRNVIDFEDMLSLAVELYEADEQAIGLVRQRYTWFSVDEYQDTNRLQEDLLHLWLGERRDLCVVGDPDQTIYTFTGASSQHLLTFAERHADARVIRLRQNYRSTPQVIELANQLIPGRELAAAGEPGPAVELVPHSSDDVEEAAVVARIRQLLAEGVTDREMAILVRTNAQLVAWESALTAAGVGFTIRGLRFFARPDVRAARAALRPGTSGTPARVAVRAWRRDLGFDEADPPAGGSGAEARDRHAALSTLLAMARELERERPGASVDDFLADLTRRDGAEADAGGTGVTLSTLHRAKGLEWDAVFLPSLEEGILPIRQATEPEELAEERRLLYVGITRARRHLVLSWAVRRVGSRGTEGRARPSRFIAELRPGGVGRPRAAIAVRPSLTEADEPLLERLIEWRRERARADGVPAYIVADNKTLAGIAANRPTDEAGLLGVPGIGPRKAETYGDDILRVIGDASG
ncbi:MAG: ATP-dependent DNA helicase UvrD2 [Candidatus Limnocylindria bacterium]